MTGFFQRSTNKKGNAILEGLTVLVVITIFAILGIYGAQVFDELNTDMQNDPEIAQEAKSTSGDLEGIFPAWYDGVFLFAFVLLVLFVVISVFLIDSHPIFFAISCILLIGVFVAAIFVGNAYDDVASDDTISAYSNQMPYMAWVMRHIAEIVIGIGFLTGIALYVKVKMA